MTDIYLDKSNKFKLDAKRIGHLLIGTSLFLFIYFLDYYPSIEISDGEVIELTRRSKAAIGIMLLAAYWWIVEVVPVGITGIIIGLIQIIFYLRPAKEVYSNYMDPSVWFIFASIILAFAFNKTGLTKRLAYKLLKVSGEKVIWIYFFTFLLTLILSLFMAHTAAAAALFPIISTIHSLYSSKEGTNFGKGLFIGMAFSAGAGSIITLFGSARGIVGLDLLKTFSGIELNFIQHASSMIIPGIISFLTIFILISIFFRPKENRIENLSKNVSFLQNRLGPINRNQIITILIMTSIFLLLSFKGYSNYLNSIDNSVFLLIGAISLFIVNILDFKDLESVPWNIILLFGGSISLGSFMWESEAAKWIAFLWIKLFNTNSPELFIISISLFTLILTNLIMNVAAVSLVLPIALTIGSNFGIEPTAILFAILTSAGMPFLFLTGAAPNTIAYQSNHFKPIEFFKVGLIMTVLIVGIVYISFILIWT